MFVICIFPIFTVFAEGAVGNKVLFGLAAVLQIGLLFTRPLQRNTVLIWVLLVVQYVFALVKTQFPMQNSNLLFYYLFSIIYAHYMCDNIKEVLDWLRRKRQFISFIVNLWTIIVGISMFIPSCYRQQLDGGYYFGSFCDTIFRLGPSAMFIQVLVLALQLIHKNKKAIWYMIIPMYCYLAGSSRTYLIIGACLLVISWYFTCKNTRTFWKTVIPLGALVLALVGASAIGEKIMYTLDDTNYGDIWFRITSSRNVIWAKCLASWSSDGLITQLLGGGIEFTYYASGHWAHNDFVEILCSFGLIGLISYLWSIRKMFVVGVQKRTCPRVISVCMVMVWLFNAFFNMHYTYFCAILCYPLLVFMIGDHFANQKKQSE